MKKPNTKRGKRTRTIVMTIVFICVFMSFGVNATDDGETNINPEQAETETIKIDEQKDTPEATKEETTKEENTKKTAVKNRTKTASVRSQAIDLAAEIAGAGEGDTVEIDGDITLSDAIMINKNITLKLNGHTVTSTLDKGSLFTIAGGKTVNIEGTGTIRSIVDGARAILVKGTLNASNIVFKDFYHAGYQEQGGAIRVEGKATITSCEFSNNGSEDPELPSKLHRMSYKPGGGAIYGYNSDITINDSKFAENTVGYLGAAILVGGTDTNLKIKGSIFENNKATTGAAITAIDPKTIILEGNVFKNNSAWDDEYSLFKIGGGYSSLASGNGGAVYILTNPNTAATLEGNTFDGNRANRGGAISFGSGTNGAAKVTIKSGIFENNEADIGGAIDYTTHNLPALELDNALVTANNAVRGGGIWICPDGDLTMNSALGGTVINNHSTGQMTGMKEQKTVFANGDDICHEGADSQDYPRVGYDGKVNVSTRGPGGVKVDWYTDESLLRYSEGSTLVRDAITNNDYPDILNEGSSKSFGIHAVIPGINAQDQARLIKESEKAAKIIIRNNIAYTRGGGIAANSPISIGTTEDTGIDLIGTLTVNKKWNGTPTADVVKVNLIRYDVDPGDRTTQIGGKFVLDRQITINKDEDWTVTFIDLPLAYIDEQGQIHYCGYTVEEEQGLDYSSEITGRTDEGTNTTIELTNTPTTNPKDEGEDDSKGKDKKTVKKQAKKVARKAAVATTDDAHIWGILTLLILSAIATVTLVRKYYQKRGL